MLFAIVKKRIEGLSYKASDLIPLYIGNRGQYLWHVGAKIVTVPKDSISLDLSILNKLWKIIGYP